MNCWICGKLGDSGEHLMKASDLRSVFGAVSQDHPLYIHSKLARNVRKPSVNSAAFKSKALLCASCNNAQTQRYDRAWERLSCGLRKLTSLKSGRLIKLNKIFMRPPNTAMLDVHLYFVKLFGCRIVEHSIPINIQSFAKALLLREAHPLIFIAIGPSPFTLPGKNNAGWSEISGDQLPDGSCIFASWFYHLNNVAVNIMYALPGEKRDGLFDAWHPDTLGRLMRLAHFN